MLVKGAPGLNELTNTDLPLIYWDSSSGLMLIWFEMVFNKNDHEGQLVHIDGLV